VYVAMRAAARLRSIGRRADLKPALLFAARLNACGPPQIAMDACDTFDLAFRRKAFVETFVAKFAHLLSPRREPPAPALDAALVRLGVRSGEVGANANHG